MQDWKRINQSTEKDGDRDGDRKVGEMIYGSELEQVPAVQLQDVAFLFTI